MYTLLKKLVYCFEKLKNLLFYNGDFSGCESQENLGFTESDGNQYQATEDYFKKVLQDMNISENDAIIDIGCGKGKAMYMFSKYNFSKIGGFDISEKLVNIANDNFNKLGISSKCSAWIADASTYNDYDEYNWFYFYNPVPSFIFKTTFQNILESINRNPRKCVIIYSNSENHDYIISTSNFKEIKTYKSFMWYLVNKTPLKLLGNGKDMSRWFSTTCYELTP